MDMPKLSDGHKKLERLVGNWAGEEKLSPSPWDPKGGPAIGKVSNRSTLDGFIVTQEYEQIRNGVTSFKGFGIFSYDANRDCHVMHWIDSMGSPVSEFTGSVENNVWTLTNQGQMGHSRAIFDFSKDNQYHFKMDISQDGKSWYTFMEGSYTKK
jgi:hypothetical protein